MTRFVLNISTLSSGCLDVTSQISRCEDNKTDNQHYTWITRLAVSITHYDIVGRQNETVQPVAKFG